MTKTEQAELEQLNMTPEALAEKQAKVNELLGGLITVRSNQEIDHDIMNKPTRKPRSDKGVPKGPKPKPEGVLTQSQVAHIDALVTAMNEANTESFNAAQKAYNARQAYYAYLDELAGKTK